MRILPAPLTLAGSLILASLVACAANSGAESPGSEHTAATADGFGPSGCWAFETQGESVGDSLQVWLSGEMLPPMVELDTLPTPTGTEATGPYRAFSWFDGRRETSPFNEWQLVGSDSVRIQRTGALSGLMLRMAQREDRLEGRLIAFTDATARGDSGRREVSLSADEVACP